MKNSESIILPADEQAADPSQREPLMENFSSKYKLETFAYPNGLIEQDMTDLTGQIHRRIIETQDDQIRKALISLGWTPPGSDEESFDIEPIALSDRRPDKTDCNEKGYCWFGQQQVYGIYSGYWIWDLKHRHSSLGEYERHWLPASVKRLPARTTTISTGN